MENLFNFAAVLMDQVIVERDVFKKSEKLQFGVKLSWVISRIQEFKILCSFLKRMSNQKEVL
jgi:hypothetical protein